MILNLLFKNMRTRTRQILGNRRRYDAIQHDIGYYRFFIRRLGSIVMLDIKRICIIGQAKIKQQILILYFFC
ncbi:Uncharacterised protein [Mycobacteroides abscessus subsp. abscessus]|nr:Uncharacterised protein [Mycobacteroides abscessus subsp. abscessus]